MANNINIAQLCISNPKELNDYSRIYVADPEKKFLEKFGRLAILITVRFKGELEDKTLSSAKEWTQNCIDFASSIFYKSLKTGADLEKEFEDLLQSLNKWFSKEKVRTSELFEKHISEIDISTIAVHGKDVYFASIGDIKTHLIPAQSDKPQELSSGKDKSTKFSNLMNGLLEQDNILFFTSSNIFDYFSTKKLVQVIKENPVNIATDKIKQLLSEQANKINLLLLIVSNRDESLLVQTQKKSSEKSAFARDRTDKEEKTAIEVDDKTEQEISPKISVEKTRKKRIARIKNIALLAAKSIRASKKPKLLQKKQTINWQKTLFIVLLVFGLLFIISIILLSTQQFRAQQKKDYVQTIEKLREIESEISVSLIYDDETQMQTLLTQMAQLLNQLPKNTDKQKQVYDLFYAKYSASVNKFYHLTVIEEPQLLIDLNKTYKNISPAGITNLFNDFYIFDASNNYIYRFNVETKEIEVVNNTSTNVGRLKKLIPLDNDILIGYDNNQKIATFNTIDNKLEQIKLTREHESKTINDMYLYNDRLYILESEQNQIYKYSKTIDGFGKEETWIKDNTNITDARTFAIDGSIYILKQSSEIYKFFRGNRTDFELSSIQPLLSTSESIINEQIKNIKLFTSADMKYIYLLDGPTNRLLILSKDGKLIKQFTSPVFDNLIDFIVSRNENTAWLLNNTKIFEIELK